MTDGIGGTGGTEGDLDPVVAGALQIGLAAAAVLVECLVDHVPVGELALVVGHHAVDVIDHRLAQIATTEALHPARLLGVPGQGVAADLHTVLGGPVVDLVACAEAELPPLGLGGVGLHFVLGRHHVELRAAMRGVPRVAKPARRDRGAEVPAGLCRRRTERAGRGIRVGHHGDHARDRDKAGSATEQSPRTQGSGSPSCTRVTRGGCHLGLLPATALMPDVAPEHVRQRTIVAIQTWAYGCASMLGDAAMVRSDGQ